MLWERKLEMAMFPVITIIKNISVEKKRMCRMQTRH